MNCVHPDAVISPSAILGYGNYVGPLAIIGPDVKIGNMNIINDGSFIAHDSIIGNYNHIAPHSTLCGFTKIGDFNLVGANSTLIPKISIGTSNTIGASALVNKCVTENSVCVGVPIRTKTKPCSEKVTHQIKWLANKSVNKDLVDSLLSECAEKNAYTNIGPIIPKLEALLRKKLCIDNSKAVILTGNGTSALHAVASTFNHAQNSELKYVTQSFTFPSSAQGPMKNGYIVDIDADGGPDLNLVDRLKDAKVLVVTNVHGNVVDIDKYVDYCKQKNLLLVLDNAATMFTHYKGSNSCNYGNAATISFHHTKPFGFAEGGCVIIDVEYESIMRSIINFGLDNSLGEASKYSPYGSNYRMSDLNACYIYAYFNDNFDKIVASHKTIYEKFVGHVGPKDKWRLYPNFSSGIPVCSSICLLCDGDKFDNTVLPFVTRKYYKPLDRSCPVSENYYQRIVCLPCNMDLTDDMIDQILKFFTN
jgi:dTDP-4-amino-4,6-dideoxygalactose transaminase/serine acetyltransferase